MSRSALEAFAALLDRSVEQMAEVSADARHFDRQRVARLSDIWDNNTLPLVRAATAGPAWRRDRLARKGLRWMADLHPIRQAWMTEAEPAVAAFLPEPRQTVHRDYDGHVLPTPVPMTEPEVAGIEIDYDLAAASVRDVTGERDATGLRVLLALETPRRYRADPQVTRPALLRLNLHDVSDLFFDAHDRQAISLAFTGTGITVGIGTRGTVQAVSGEIWIDDTTWHQSHAGRAANAVTPGGREPRDAPELSLAFLRGEPLAAAHVLRRKMLDIRAVRHPHLAPCVPVHETCSGLADAGSAIASAGTQRGHARSAAFRSLRQEWTQRCGHSDLREPAPPMTGSAQLRYASYTAPHRDWGTVDREPIACLNLAQPQDDPAKPWQLRGGEIASPASFRITMAAFEGVHPLHIDGSALTLTDALIVR